MKGRKTDSSLSLSGKNFGRERMDVLEESSTWFSDTLYKRGLS